MLMAKPKLANHLGTNSIFLSSVILYDAFNHPLNASIILILFKAITDLDKTYALFLKPTVLLMKAIKLAQKHLPLGVMQAVATVNLHLLLSFT